jgi:mono/diheme cytochrome c family protein
MKRSAVFGNSGAILLLALPPQGGAAQPTAGPALSPTQLEGRNLFTQHCVVCHVKTLVTAVRSYGPPLSKDSLGGQDDLLREQITNGSPNMPGFKYNFDAAEVSAIIAYLKTLPAAR